MKTKQLLMTLLLLLCPLWAIAQYWESGTSKTGSVSKNVHDVWYTISLSEDGEVSLTLEPLGNIGSENLTIYAIVDGENVQRAFAWVDGSNRTLTCPNLKPGVYKVKMNASPRDSKASGTYRLTYNFTAPTVKTDPTPNDTWQDCPLLEDGVKIGGHLGYAYSSADTDKQDWFKFEVPKDGKAQFELRSAATLTFGYAEICALKADRADVMRRGGKWLDYSDSTLVFEVPNCQAGTYYLSLPRYGGYGIYHLTYRFIAPATDSDPEPNDDWQTATRLSDGILQNCHLGYAYNDNTDVQDWYQLEVKEDGKLTFVTRSAPTLTLGYAQLQVLNADQTDVQARTGKWLDYPDSTLVFEIPNVSAGTYYFQMPRYGGYGTYDLTYYFTSHSEEADPEPNNDWQAATVLKSGPSVTGQLGYDYNQSTDVEDWYKLNVPEEGSITLTIRSEETLKIGYATINTPKTDEDGLLQRKGQWLDYPDSTLTMILPNAAAGDYYLMLPRYGGYGTYSLQYTFTPCSHQNDAEPNDEWAKASEFAAGSTIDARLGYDYSNSLDAHDWFKLDVPEEGAIMLTVCSEKTLTLGYAEIKVPNADGTEIKTRKGQWLDNPGDTLTMILPNSAAGTYYLYMPRYGGYGGYRMTYDFIPCALANEAADNDTWDKATPIEQGSTREARLGYDYSNSLDAQDWFKLDVPEEGTITLNIWSEKTLTLGYATIEVPKTDSDETLRREGKWLDHPDSTLTMTLPSAAAGTYYLYMPRYGGYGGYRVTYSFTPCAYANDIAGNDSIGSAILLENGTTAQGRLGYDYSNSADKEDWYKFVMPADGSATFTIQSEQTLKIGYAYIYALSADSTDVVSREGKWLDYPDSTLVFKKDDLAPGTYYLYLPRYSGYGGYTVKSTFTKNPFYQEKQNNTDFAHRIILQEGKPVSGTLGYAYRNGDAATEAWFDLGLMHGRQIDVNVEVESSHSLSIGVATIYKYKGDYDDGAPRLERVADARLERSSGTISYIDKNDEDSHYVFYLPRYSGYGGYTVTFGQEQEEGTIELANAHVNVMTEGRNTVRKGVPCENPITITNTSAEKTGKFFVAIAASENVDILGFRMNSNRGQQYLPIDSVTIMDGGDCEHTAVFLVPSLDPWESYTFTMISEGKGDIAYSRTTQEFHAGQRRIIISGTTFAVVAVLGYVADAVISDKIDDYINDRVSAVFELDETERQQYARCMGTTVQQLGIEKEQTGIAAYTVKSVVKKTMTTATELLPGGKIATKAGSLLETMQSIVPSIRRRLWYWIYKDLGYIKDDVDIIDGKAAITDVVASWDPNEMVGPAGVGENHYIGQTQTVNYRILFENKAEAGDAAYRVRISDELDESVFDVSTVRFGETSHDGVGYNWEMKREGNTLSWDIKGIELPPNVVAPEGEGYVSFSVDLKPGLADGTQLKNKATIIFDKNFPIETNEFVNTLDLTPPSTTMTGATKVKNDSVSISCQSVDGGSGVDHYLLFAAKGEGDYEYQGQYFTNTMICPVTGDGSDYSFYVLAVDAVGNAERVAPDAVTGIRTVRNDQLPVSLKIYTIDGRYIGSSLKHLPKGVYIVNGKKEIVK